MTELLTADEMRTLEAKAIASGEVTGLELMERAGQGVVGAIFLEWPELQATYHRAVVLCGPGNNGGDGFVVARLLRKWGWEVHVFLYGDPEKLPPDARTNYDRWREMGEVTSLGVPGREVKGLEAVVNLIMPPREAAIMVDALFGTGLTRQVKGLAPVYDMGEFCHAVSETKWVAVDVPTGLCADSGRLYPRPKEMESNHPVVPADLTVTFHTPKVGHVLASGPLWCRKVAIADIGLHGVEIDDGFFLDPETYEPLPSKRTYLGPGNCFEAFVHDLFLPKSHGNKYDHGHVLVLSGPAGRGGAARLAARGALRIGAGLVTVACPPDAVFEHAARLDAIMVRPVADGAALTEMLADPRISTICLGPGLGLDARARDLVAAALVPGAGGRRSVVLDADALTLLAQDAALFAQLHENCVLTPHAGEFARLFPDFAERLDAEFTTGPGYSKVDATREAAKRAGCTVLYKGPDTVIGAPTGECSVNAASYEREAPWLATAGSGDVLSGFVAGLLARNYGTRGAAEKAAALHVACALKFGPGLIAEDLPETLPAVFRE